MTIPLILNCRFSGYFASPYRHSEDTFFRNKYDKGVSKRTQIHYVALELGLELRLIEVERTLIFGIPFTLDIDGDGWRVMDSDVTDVATSTSIHCNLTLSSQASGIYTRCSTK